MPEQGGAL